MKTTLQEMKAKNIELIKNRSAISGFRGNMSLGSILEKGYIQPHYTLKKGNESGIGIGYIYSSYGSKRLLFVGDAGSGKTSIFLRLFIGIDDEEIRQYDTEFYYCYIPDLYWETNSESQYYTYYRELNKIINGGGQLNGILLLDGLEEAFFDNATKASKWLQKIVDSNITFWVSCRTEFYYRLGDTITQYFSEIVEIQKWEKEDFDQFVSLCLRDNWDKEIIKERVSRIIQRIGFLYERPLFATMILFVAEDDCVYEVNNEYEIINLFLQKWIEREKKRTRRAGKIPFDKIQKVALNIYLKNAERPKYTKELRIFRDLLVLTGHTGAIHGFTHREFLVYFISNAMIEAATEHPENVVFWFSQTFYDDITNMVKPVLSRLSQQTSTKIYSNLFKIYRRSYEDKDFNEKEFGILSLNVSNVSLKLRDEILYFIFKLRNIDHERFAKYAYDNSLDIMLFLGIAYGMAGVDPSSPYTIEFAKKLVPGSPEAERNRGWAICFFGDVEGEDGYVYRDLHNSPWTRVRENKLKRLADNSRKYVTRVLDIPLLYCFYHSRHFLDCTSYQDYSVIKNTDISLPCFREEQRRFLAQQKNQLVSTYIKYMLHNEIKRQESLIETINREDIKMNNDSEKVIIEVDAQLTQKILRQAQYREDVYKNQTSFWSKNGHRVIEQYKKLLSVSPMNNINEEEFEKRLTMSHVLIISANSVEGAIISLRLREASGLSKLDAWPYEGHLLQFAIINGVSVCHVWTTDTGSFTQYGSFSALKAVLAKATPKYVMSVGVAFGIDPNNQRLGDVLVSKEFVFYDHFNKVTDGSITLKPEETARIDQRLSPQLHQLDTQIPPPEVGNFKWHFGSILTGGTVLSDAAEKDKLVDAANNIGYKIVGGEMEASGIYYACQKREGYQIPFLIIKGICDWGAVKNGWKEIVGTSNESIDGNLIKDCVQAFACDNAIKVLFHIMRQLNYNLPNE